MISRSLTALVLCLWSAAALAQTNPGIPIGPLNSNVLNQAFTRKADYPGILSTIAAQPFIFTSPQSFIGANTAPITQGSQLTVQNSAITQSTIFGPLTGGLVYDVVRSVLSIPASSSAVLSANAFGAYVRNRSGTGASVGGGVAYYALVTCGFSNSSCWGENYRLEDCETPTCGGLTGIKMVAGEDDFAVTNTLTTIGARTVILSGLQPTFASGWGCSTVSSAVWTFCVVSLDGASTVALQAGALATSGTNVSSQKINFSRFDSGGTERTDFLQAGSSGNLFWSGAGYLQANGLQALGSTVAPGSGVLFGDTIVSPGTGNCPSGTINSKTVVNCLVIGVGAGTVVTPLF